ncbi:MarR family winged helix-turn-helix transcriptional regulator [Actinomycetospora sp. NBC_00405]|uniref:MarR family winged helix-turn-helix transcriptional regulator n=1 Tax=Actinomycetospora sp. NBC_00405 TaxID=2975952 RepID=UPI003FA49EB3
MDDHADGAFTEQRESPPADQFDGVDPLALENQVCFALAVAARTVISVYKPLLEPMNLTHPQYLVMLALWQHAPRTVTELSRLLDLDPGTLSPLLKRLETAGYLTRERQPGNERALAVGLTPAGVALRQQAERIPPAIVERLDMDLPELRDLHSALTEIIAAARRAQAEQVAPHTQERDLPPARPA